MRWKRTLSPPRWRPGVAALGLLLTGPMVLAAPTHSLRPCDTPPVADAGPDRFLAVTDGGPVSVALDGGRTGDRDLARGDTLFLSWSIAGTALDRIGPAPALDLSPGTYPLTLTVEDACGHRATDTAVVTILPSTRAEPAIRLMARILSNADLDRGRLQGLLANLGAAGRALEHGHRATAAKYLNRFLGALLLEGEEPAPESGLETGIKRICGLAALITDLPLFTDQLAHVSTLLHQRDREGLERLRHRLFREYRRWLSTAGAPPHAPRPPRRR